jgi:RecA/RadA recombinase
MKNNEIKIQRIEQEQKQGKKMRLASYVKYASIECFPTGPLYI